MPKYFAEPKRVRNILAFMKTTSAKTQKIKIMKLQICKFTEPVICKWLGHLFLLMSHLSWLIQVWSNRKIFRNFFWLTQISREKHRYYWSKRLDFGFLWSFGLENVPWKSGSEQTDKTNSLLNCTYFKNQMLRDI